MRAPRPLALVLALAACQGEIGTPSVMGASPRDPATPAGPGSPSTPGSPNNPGNPGGPGPSPTSSPSPTPTPSPTAPPDACAGRTAPEPGPAPMRRLSNTEWRYALIDLLGPAHAAAVNRLAEGLTPATESLGFQNSAAFLDVPAVLAQQYMDAAEALSTEVGRSLVTCDPANGEAACARSYVESLGRRAYRRPLSAEELARFDALYTEARAHGGFDVAIEWATYAILQSPAFLHRVELGNGRPTGYEMASRLSFFFWHSVPDEALLDAAAAGSLDTAAGVQAAAERLMADPKAERLTRFFEEWLDLDRLDGLQRDPGVFPGLDPALGAKLRQESDAFVSYVVFDPAADGRLSTLLTAPFTFADSALARHYGLSGVSGGAFQRVAVDPSERRGILTQGGVLAVQDKPARTSIVKRGLKIRTDLLCQIIGAPPNGVELDLPAPQPGQSQRQRLEAHRTNESCAACHNMMDPIGVAFERIDAVGRVRDMDEAGARLDVSTVLEHTDDVDGAVSGAPALAERLAQSRQVSDCFVKQLFRYAFARGETAADACTEQRLEQAFAASNGDIRALLVAITQTDAFLYRPQE